MTATTECYLSRSEQLVFAALWHAPRSGRAASNVAALCPGISQWTVRLTLRCLHYSGTLDAPIGKLLHVERRGRRPQTYRLTAVGRRFARRTGFVPPARRLPDEAA